MTSWPPQDEWLNDWLWDTGLFTKPGNVLGIWIGAKGDWYQNNQCWNGQNCLSMFCTFQWSNSTDVEWIIKFLQSVHSSGLHFFAFSLYFHSYCSIQKLRIRALSLLGAMVTSLELLTRTCPTRPSMTQGIRRIGTTQRDRWILWVFWWDVWDTWARFYHLLPPPF